MPISDRILTSDSSKKQTKPNSKQLVAGGFPPKWEEGQIISCGKVGLRDRDALEGRGKEAQRDC